MSFRIFRFEVSNEVARDGANVIYDVLDTADSSALQLYEWTPSPAESPAAAAKFAQVRSQLDGIETFASGHRLYVAVPRAQAKSTLDILRTHGLFTGIWPGVYQKTDLRTPSRSSDQLPPDASIREVQPRRSRRLLLTILTLLIASLVLGAWWWRNSSQTSEPQDATNLATPMPAAATSKPVQIKYFNIEPKTPQPGQNVTLSWEVINAKEIWIKGLGPQSILVRSPGAQSFPVPHNAQKIVLEAMGEGANNIARCQIDLYRSGTEPDCSFKGP